MSSHALVFTHHPQGWSRPRLACIDGTIAHPVAVEEPLFNQLLHQALDHRTVEAEPNGAGHVIGGGATRDTSPRLTGSPDDLVNAGEALYLG